MCDNIAIAIIQRAITINEAKKLKSDNFTRSNKEKSNIAIDNLTAP